MTITTREFFYDDVTVSDATELDYLKNKLTEMELSTVDIHTVNSVTEFRPDIISMQYYGTYDLGWLIAEHNNFLDPVTDLYIGRVVNIPSITDYYQFFNRNSRKV